MTENDLTAAVLDLARLLGWKTLHLRPAMTAHGYRTAVQGDGKGWPDIVALRGSEKLAVELKSATGQLTTAQRAWLEALAGGGFETAVWKPQDWQDGTIARALGATVVPKPPPPRRVDPGVITTTRREPIW